MKLLLVEDDFVLGDALNESLKHKGFIVDWIRDGAMALSVIKTNHYDLVILDLGLPKLSGLEILKIARSKQIYIPIMVISARESTEDKIAGLNLGADDYLAKPFKFLELEARIQALLRRSQNNNRNVLTFGALEFDSVNNTFHLNNQPLDLSKKELDLLKLLITKTDSWQSKESIIEKIYTWDQDITPNAIEVIVHRLRNKFNDTNLSIINKRNLGYRLVMENDAV
jgi:two-component system OmpR family response regulator